MGVQILLLLALTVFRVDTFPLNIFQINQRQTKEYSYEVFKDILIQNLIVTTDNLKLILNWERENTWYKAQDEEKSNMRLTNYNVVKNLTPFQYATASKNDLSKKENGEDKLQDGIKAAHDIPGSHTAKVAPDSLTNFELSTYLTKISPDEVDKPTEYEIKSEIEDEEEEKENYDDNLNPKKRVANEYSTIVLSEENLLNYGNSNSLELDNNSNPEINSGKAKRQAEGENPLPVPTGDSDTQMFMGTFQAVMRPMKLPSLG